jgi:mono/diheme cytochrome c family protein
MRERIARAVSGLAIGVVALLAVVFASGQNPTDGAQERDDEGPVLAQAPAAPPLASAPAAADSARGHAVFLAQGCARCHSVAGAGSPRAPLDGVGARRSPAELRAWSTGAASLADALAPSVLQAKQAYAKLPAADLDALVAFLASLKRAR